jgi:hypothetical protein
VLRIRPQSKSIEFVAVALQINVGETDKKIVYERGRLLNVN